MTEKLVSMRNKKGFTLVELLVVIVIMCILAAILIPTFAKYIDKAENATIVAEARAAHVALSVVCQDEAMAGTETIAADTVVTNPTEEDNTVAAEAKNLANVDGTITSVTCDEYGKVTAFVYENGDKTVTWEEGNNQYTITPTAKGE